MQLRLVCAGIIVACGAGIGLRLAKKSAGRARLLRELIDALKLLSVRSARGGLPLAAALEESASGLLREIGAKMHKHGLNAEEALRKMNPDELGPEERGALEKQLCGQALSESRAQRLVACLPGHILLSWQYQRFWRMRIWRLVKF